MTDETPHMRISEFTVDFSACMVKVWCVCHSVRQVETLISMLEFTGSRRMTDEEIKAILKDWHGRPADCFSKEAIMVFNLLLNMNDADRKRALNSLKAFFCLSCGNNNPHCYCWNDE